MKLLRTIFLFSAFVLYCQYGFGQSPQLDTAKPISKIVFGSCVDQNKPCPVWSSVAAQKPELLLMLGDNVYCDVENGKLIDPEPTQMLKAYTELAKVPAFMQLKNSVPMMATWDDHDFGKNDEGVKWKHKEYARKLFLEFVQAKPEDPRWKRQGIYDSSIVGPEGKRVQIIMLDNRYNLTVPPRGKRTIVQGYGSVVPYIPTDGEGMTILGEEQWAWLKEQLLKPAELRLICSGIQILPEEHPFEKWANIPAERERLFKLINETKANGVVLLSGDRHLAEMCCKVDALSYPLFECTASGWNQGSKNWRPAEKSKYRIGGMPYGDNFGSMQVDWNESNPKITLQIRDESGDVAVAHSFRLGMLMFKQEKADKAEKKQKQEDAEKVVELPRPMGVISGEEANKKEVGADVTVQFYVASGRPVNMGKRILLNSDKEFNSEKNFTVVINDKAMTGKFEKATFDTFKGKTIRAKGKISKFQDKAQIQINEAASIEIVEAKKEENKEEKKEEKKP